VQIFSSLSPLRIKTTKINYFCTERREREKKRETGEGRKYRIIVTLVSQATCLKKNESN
jgi:hypothetical protein